MKIYTFIFVLTCCMFEHTYSSSLNWKEIILIRQQVRGIKSIIDNALILLKIAMYKKGTLEVISCYKEAKSKLSGLQQIGYSEVTNCIRNSTKDITAGIICAANVQQTVRETSQAVSVEAIKCISDLNIDDLTCITNKTSISEMVYQKPNPISKEINVE